MKPDEIKATELKNTTAILEVARRLGLSYNLDELLDLIVSETVSVLDCDRATLFLYDPSRDELYSKIAKGVDQIRIPADRGIAGACAQAKTIINIADAYSDPRFNPEVDRQTGYRTKNILSCPLIGLEDQLMGELQAINKRTGSFSATDEWLLETLNSQAAIAIQRAYLLQEHTEKQRLEHELNLAREIQMALLPKEMPQVPGYDIAGWNRPAEQTGGDCYDFMPVSSQELGVLLADASGHGIAPALVVAELRAVMHSLFGLTMSLEQMMGRVNTILCRDLPADRFVTTFCGILNSEHHVLHYCSGGQAPLLHIKPSAGKVITLGATSCPIGIVSGMPFPPAEPIQLDRGDLFLLVTDGFTEWFNPEGEQFGTERLEQYALDHAALPAAEFITGLRHQVEAFGLSTPQKDDLTAVVIKRK